MSKTFSPIKVGANELQHRLAMAPLTRYRAGDDHVPGEIVAEYYGQRASVPGTLIISEATFISPAAGGSPNVPGLYNKDQIKGWKAVTDAVHSKGSFIWLQLWHLGRAAKAEDLAPTYTVKSSSATPMNDSSPPPEAMTEEEIQQTIKDYAQCARNAIEAGFDGVEIHGANGYLVDQFTQDTCNKRTDAWGGSIEKRARFGLEVAKAVTDAVGSSKVGIRLSPFSDFQGMKMADPVPQFSYLATELKKYNLAYLHVVESRISGNVTVDSSEQIDFLLDIWANQSPVLVAGGFTAETAQNAIEEHYKSYDIVVVFGRYFVSNPDLVYRVQKGIELTPYDRDTFYKAKSTEGYTDYPFSKEFEKEKL